MRGGGEKKMIEPWMSVVKEDVCKSDEKRFNQLIDHLSRLFQLTKKPHTHQMSETKRLPIVVFQLNQLNQMNRYNEAKRVLFSCFPTTIRCVETTLSDFMYYHESNHAKGLIPFCVVIDGCDATMKDLTQVIKYINQDSLNNKKCTNYFIITRNPFAVGFTALTNNDLREIVVI